MPAPARPERKMMNREERASYVDELRQRWLTGTLDEVLVPDDADIDRLARALTRRPRGALRPN
jgi:hypothetical protein